MAIPLLIDCDPGHDDAIALLLALASPELEVLGVTTVAGNVGLDKTTPNALRVLELAERTDVSVAAGFARPLYRPLQIAANVHGESGLDGPMLPVPRTAPVDVHAVDFLAEKISASDEPVTLVPVGPLTNIAVLLNSYPDLGSQIARIVLMGGAIATGNVTPAAEFNIYVDPEAAHRVFHSGLPITMMGLDVTHKALLDAEHADQLRGTGRVGKFVAELLDFFLVNHPRHYASRGGVPIHDALAVAHLIWPDLVETVDCHVTVETQSDLCRGRTVVDRWHVTGQTPNAAVGVELDSELFAKNLLERLGTYPREE
ncbi:MAG TPA: nucleoside hydrolase [Acidimicrobiia bacterium]|jgi:pyrimidine-specific ribonucleoside hydrolase